MPAKGSKASTGNKMSQSAASRIQSTQAKGGQPTGKDSFPARAQSASTRSGNAAGSTPMPTTAAPTAPRSPRK